MLDGISQDIFKQIRLNIQLKGKFNTIFRQYKPLKKIDKVYGNNGKIANVLIQINIGREEQKYGILEEDLDELLQEIEKCEFVRAKGIMVIIPKGIPKKIECILKGHMIFIID